MQDAGATRNRRTENGPSGTPAPTRVRPSKYAGIQRCTDAGTIMAQGTINVVRGSDSDASLKTAGAICAHHRVERRSGSGDRSAGDSVRNLFAPQLQLDEREIQKPMVFGGVLFHISFAVERNMAAGGIHAGHGCNPQSENGKRAVGDAGPYGGIDESSPVFKGAPMRAVGDAGPYGGCGLRHGEISVGGVCPLGAFKRGTRERVAFSGGL